jgi:hypothetical protein
MVTAREGLVIRAHNGFKERYYVILCDPIPGGHFLIVTFTDADKYSNPMVWASGEQITNVWALSKDSVLHVHTVRMRMQSWIDENVVSQHGICMPPVLTKICCNLCQLENRIDPGDKAIFERYRAQWCTEDCDQYK